MNLKLKPKIKKENPLRSKTNWTALIGAVLPLIPVVGPWIAANPQAYIAIMGAVVAIARNFDLLDN